MTPEQREELVRLLQKGEELSPAWSRILFPPEKRECELVYHGKDREENILADTLAVPLQPVRTFGDNGVGWHNMLIFGDNLQAMKTLLEMKKAGRLRNADGTPGVRLVYIDPPFSTRRDFLGTEDQKAYQDKLAGAEFLEFLRRRLVLIRELLSDDGTFFVHLDLKKIHHAKLLLDEIFGESRILNEIVWHYENKLGTGGDLLDRRHDTLLWYAASNRVSLRGTMAKAKTRGRTRGVSSQEGHLDRFRPALMIPLLLGASRIYPATVPVPNENPISNNFLRVNYAIPLRSHRRYSP